MADREKIRQDVKATLIKAMGIDCESVQIFDEYVFIELWDKNDNQRKFRINWPSDEARDEMFADKGGLMLFLFGSLLMLTLGKD